MDDNQKEFKKIIEAKKKVHLEEIEYYKDRIGYNEVLYESGEISSSVKNNKISSYNKRLRTLKRYVSTCNLIIKRIDEKDTLDLEQHLKRVGLYGKCKTYLPDGPTPEQERAIKKVKERLQALTPWKIEW